MINAYIVQRHAAGSSNATVNRELAALRRAFSLAMKNEKILKRPSPA